MEYAMVAVPAAPVRRKPRHQREMVSQLLFGEAVKVLRERDALWVKIRSLHDDYEGWVTRNMLQEVKPEQAKAPVEYIAAGMLNEITINDNKMLLPVGASLPGFTANKGFIGDQEYSFAGHQVNRMQQSPGETLVQLLTNPWMNAPYLWGGRTILGIDCSGFVQVNFRMMGIDLPRDAWQQAQEGTAVKKLRDALPGDLAFFDDREEIVHVGILLSPETIIHASGRVRIDAIDKKGITNSTTGKRTHQLKAIRRYW